jgi:hypothetical protein
MLQEAKVIAQAQAYFKVIKPSSVVKFPGRECQFRLSSPFRLSVDSHFGGCLQWAALVWRSARDSATTWAAKKRESASTTKRFDISLLLSSRAVI